MPILVPVIATVLLGFYSFICFYYTFKPYKQGDESYLELLTYDFGFFGIMSMFFEFVLWLCRKVFSPRLYVFIFRIIAFFIGLIMVGVVALLWLLSRI